MELSQIAKASEAQRKKKAKRVKHWNETMRGKGGPPAPPVEHFERPPAPRAITAGPAKGGHLVPYTRPVAVRPPATSGALVPVAAAKKARNKWILPAVAATTLAGAGTGAYAYQRNRTERAMS